MRKEEENEAKEESLSLNTNNTNIILYLACKNPLLFFAVLCSRLVVITTYSLRSQHHPPHCPSTSQLNVPLAIDSTDVVNFSCTIIVFQKGEKDCFLIDHTFLPLVTTSLALVPLHILGFSLAIHRSVNWRNETNHTQTLIIPCALDPLRLILGAWRR